MRCVHAKLLAAYVIVLPFLVNATLWAPSPAKSRVIVQQDGTWRSNRSGEQTHSPIRDKRISSHHSTLHNHERSSGKSTHHKLTPKIRQNHTTSGNRQQRTNGPHADTDSGEGPFLIPLLPYGLSNQILAFKEALALAAVLNWTVIPLGFWPHTSELVAAAGLSSKIGGSVQRGLLDLDAEGEEESMAEEESNQLPPPPPAQPPTPLAMQTLIPQQRQKQSQHQQHRAQETVHMPPQLHLNASSVIPFDLVFDRSSLAPLVRILSQEEAVRQYGWSQSGRADLLVSISPTSGLEPTLRKASQAEVLDVHGVRTVRNHGFSCDSAGLSWLSRTAAGHRWVAMYSYRRIVPEARSSYHSFAQRSSACARAYHQVSARLRKSQQIVSTARNFVTKTLASMQQQQMGGQELQQGMRPTRHDGADGNVPYYIALHVRPYPDSCLEYFISMTDQPTLNFTAAEKVCTNAKLLMKMVPLVRQQLEAHSAAADQSVAMLTSGGTSKATSMSTPDTAPPRPGPPVALFVMSHPRVRDVVRRELQRLWDDPSSSRGGGGGQGHPSTLASPPTPSSSSSPSAPIALPALFFLEPSDIPAELQTHIASTSLLSTVEQQVCTAAAVFIGTKASSISVLVAQERVAAAAANDEAAIEVAERKGVGLIVGGSAAGRAVDSGRLRTRDGDRDGEEEQPAMGKIEYYTTGNGGGGGGKVDDEHGSGGSPDGGAAAAVSADGSGLSGHDRSGGGGEMTDRFTTLL